MAKVKYYAKENSSIGTHSFYAVPIPNGTLTFDVLAIPPTFRLSESRTMLASVMPNVRKVKTATAGLITRIERIRNYDQDDYKQR